MSKENMVDVVALQFEAVHEDLLGATLRVFEQMGLKTLVILNERIHNLRGSFFDTVNNYPNTQIKFMPITCAAEWDDIDEVVRAVSPKFVFFNTLQRRGPARFATNLNLPILGVVHNPALFKGEEDCISLAKTGRLDLIGLAPHVERAIKEAVPAIGERAYSHFPYDWTPDDYTPKRDYGEICKLCIPGAVDYSNRDYEGLVKHLATTDLSKVTPFEIHILTGGKDLDRLKQEVAENKIEKYFVFVDKDPKFPQTPHSSYLENLYDCDVCLALLPDDAKHYLTSKITTGIMAAIGMGMPIIAQKQVGEVYGFNAIETPHDNGYDFSKADLSPQNLRQLGDESWAAKAEGQKKNYAILEPIIRRILDAPQEQSLEGTPPKNNQQVLVDARTLEGFSPINESDVAFLNFAKNMVDHAAGQHFQDLFGLWHSGLKKDGYFLEFGALNGITASNSYLMELLGWKGIIAEPHPAYGKHLSRRNCHISHDCVWTKSNEEISFKLVEGRPALSTISGLDYEDIQEKAGFRDKFKEVKVNTIHLEDLLAQYDTPPFIDYFSIDTEGSELLILKSFDFSKYTFGVITVEHNFSNLREEIHQVLSLNGYVRKWMHLSGHDDWYVHTSVLSNSVLSEETWQSFILDLPELPVAELFGDRLSRLAKLFEETGNNRSAIDLMEKVFSQQDDNPKMRHTLAEMQEREGQMAESIANYKRAVEIDPEYEPSKKRLSNLSARAKIDNS